MARPRKTTTATPETDVVEEICSSVMAVKTLKPETFWRLLAAYPHRENASVYWYRIEPVIDRTKTGSDVTNIGIWPLDDAPADEARLVNEHGSGKYRARAVDSNRPKGHYEFANAIITIRDPNRPPVVDLMEIVPEAKENRSYIQGLRAAGVALPWEQEETEIMPQSVEGAAVHEMGALTRELLDEVKHRTPQKDPFELMLDGLRLFRSQQPDNSTLVLKVAEMMTKANAGSGKTTELMFGLISTLLTTNLKQQPVPKTDLEQFKDFLTLANELRGPGGGGGGGWADVAAAIPAMFSGAAQVMGHVVALKQMAAGGGVAGVSQPGGASVPAVVNPTTGDQQEMNIAKLMQLGERAIQAFNDGLSGEEFASAVCTLEPQLYDLLAGMGKSQIMGVMQSQPAVWAQLAPRQAEVEAFIDQFLAYGQEPPAETTETVAPPEPAA